MFISLIFQSIFPSFSLFVLASLIVITHVHPTSRAHTLPITCAHTTHSHFLTQSTSDAHTAHSILFHFFTFHFANVFY